MVDGYVRVPDKPGLGVDLNYDVIEEHLRSLEQPLWPDRRLEPAQAGLVDPQGGVRWNM